MNKIRIKKASIKDLEILIEWRIRVLYEVFSPISPEGINALIQANRQYYINCIPTENHIACFTILNKKIIGCGGVCIQQELPSPDNPTGICAYLMNIYTLPDYRGLGGAGKTVQWLIKHSLAKGARKIYLETTKMGESLYSAIGFKPFLELMKYNTTMNLGLNC